jgi:membrane-bound lytic murein transglycosylase A
VNRLQKLVEQGVSRRLRHNMRFDIPVPKSLDPLARGRKIQLPDARPSEKIAKLFPPVDPLKDQPKDQKNRARPPEASAAPNSKDMPKAAAEVSKNAEPAKAQPAAAVAHAPSSETVVAKPLLLPTHNHDNDEDGLRR